MLKWIDSAVGRIVEAAGKDANVIILTISGMGPNYGWSYQLDDILHRLETGPKVSTHSSYDLLRDVWQRIPHRMKKRVFTLKQEFREWLLERGRRRRQAFALPMNERDGAVRINLIGREPDELPAYHKGRLPQDWQISWSNGTRRCLFGRPGRHGSAL